MSEAQSRRGGLLEGDCATLPLVGAPHFLFPLLSSPFARSAEGEIFPSARVNREAGRGRRYPRVSLPGLFPPGETSRKEQLQFTWRYRPGVRSGFVLARGSIPSSFVVPRRITRFRSSCRRGRSLSRIRYDFIPRNPEVRAPDRFFADDSAVGG